MYKLTNFSLLLQQFVPKQDSSIDCGADLCKLCISNMLLLKLIDF
uniref:Uncharacterized protein n=1 Tax=Amphimedon queenslandica TaxID=400682 RepID=A0A1X7TYU0_AMPQE